MTNIILTHNFDGKKFKWLYAKYAYGCNLEHHCTNAIRGRYGKRFSRLSKDFMPGQCLELNEYPIESWDAIYICGVSSNGYAKHENYSHNVHAVILQRESVKSHWEFENWMMDVENGIFEAIPSEKEIDVKYLKLPKEFYTCRMFRWAVWHYRNALENQKS